MTHVDNTLGNILIKHHDKWRGNYYLRDDLTFTVNRALAARFYLLKAGDTTILNGDRISINSGNRTIMVDHTNTPHLSDRDYSQRHPNTFIITNGTENTNPITYETEIFLISDKTKSMALKYEWGMDLIGPDASVSEANVYKPKEHPNLINSNYGETCEFHINTFQFFLEKADGPITNLTDRVTIAEPNKGTLDGYKAAILIVLLMVLLALCIVVSK